MGHRQETADDELIRALFEEHGMALLAFATRLTADRGAAEDILQETLLRAWQHPEDLASDRWPVRAWLFTVVKNLATDRLRARHARPAEVAVTPVTSGVTPDPTDRLVEQLVISDALDRLSHEQRVVLRHIYLHGRTVNETADRLGIPAGTVKSRCYYGLAALRDQGALRVLAPAPQPAATPEPAVSGVSSPSLNVFRRRAVVCVGSPRRAPAKTFVTQPGKAVA
jgi:RNA polymerase sigma-70 factor (ECF subfamily)